MKQFISILIAIIMVFIIGCKGGSSSDPSASFGCEDPSYGHIIHYGVWAPNPVDGIGTFSNSAMVVHGQVQKALEAGLMVWMHSAYWFWYNKDTNTINWNAWEYFAEDFIDKYYDDIEGIFLIDEPDLPGIAHDYEDLQIMANHIKRFYPDILLWVNWSWKGASNPLPPEIDVVSVTPDYGAKGAGHYKVFVDQMRSNMHSHQEMFLIGDGYNQG